MLYKEHEPFIINASVQKETDVDFIPSFYYTFDVPHKHVGDVLTEKEVNQWHHACPVLIDAGVGLGKTTFVYERLIPRAQKAGRNVLLISNRIALSVQQKRNIMELLEDPDLEYLTPAGIVHKEDFGMVKVITYQGLHSFLEDPANKGWCEKLMYVVADEVHFFTSDSMFNRDTNWILYLLTHSFCSAIRVYLTATPWEVMTPLANAEKNNYHHLSDRFFAREYDCPPSNREFIHYRFKRDCTPYNLRFFGDQQEIADMINQLPDEKFLVFAAGIKKAEEFRALLNEPSDYLDSSKKTTPEWAEILENECFEAHVLVSTSVLDCGVNIHDPALKHIVVFSDDRTSVMQMVGRKRLELGEQITVWVQDLSNTSANARRNRCHELLKFEAQYDACRTREEYNQFCQMLWRAEPQDQLRKLFSVSMEKIRKNELAFVTLKRRWEFYDRILNSETTFREEVENWFEKEHPPLAGELDKFYQEYGEQELDAELQAQLRKIITDMCHRKGLGEKQPTRTNSLKHQALNNRLITLEQPYRIASRGKIWILTKDFEEVVDDEG